DLKLSIRQARTAAMRSIADNTLGGIAYQLLHNATRPEQTELALSMFREMAAFDGYLNGKKRWIEFLASGTATMKSDPVAACAWSILAAEDDTALHPELNRSVVPCRQELSGKAKPLLEQLHDMHA